MIDVIIPNRNAPQSLWLTLTHLWSHAWTPRIASVTLIDNCSNDAGLDPIYQIFQRKDKHQIIYNETNVGVWNSINRGLALSRSEFVMVLTSDVLLGPDALEDLRAVMRCYPDILMMGPEVHTGISEVHQLAKGQHRLKPYTHTYNGAAWMMRWSVLREKVGWFDPAFLVCFGDTDYAERMTLAGLQYGVAVGIPCVHLDKQSRRADNTALGDSVNERQDGLVFHAKWKDHPEVLAKHGLPDAQRWAAMKERDGWKAKAVGTCA